LPGYSPADTGLGTMKTVTTETTPRLIELPEIDHGRFGALCFGQFPEHFPFVAERIFFVHGVSAEAVRGGHAHIKTSQIVFCVHGAVTIWLYHQFAQACRFRLESPRHGLLIPPMWWTELGEYQDDTVTVVAASHPYEEADYIRQPELFFHDTPCPDPVSQPHI